MHNIRTVRGIRTVQQFAPASYSLQPAKNFNLGQRQTPQRFKHHINPKLPQHGASSTSPGPRQAPVSPSVPPSRGRGHSKEVPITPWFQPDAARRVSADCSGPRNRNSDQASSEALRLVMWYLLVPDASHVSSQHHVPALQAVKADWPENEKTWRWCRGRWKCPLSNRHGLSPHANNACQ